MIRRLKGLPEAPTPEGGKGFDAATRLLREVVASTEYVRKTPSPTPLTCRYARPEGWWRFATLETPAALSGKSRDGEST